MYKNAKLRKKNESLKVKINIILYFLANYKHFRLII